MVEFLFKRDIIQQLPKDTPNLIAIKRKEEELTTKAEKLAREENIRIDALLRAQVNSNVIDEEWTGRSEGARLLHHHILKWINSKNPIKATTINTTLDTLCKKYTTSIFYEKSIHSCTHLHDVIHIGSKSNSKTASTLLSYLLDKYKLDNNNDSFKELLLNPTSDGFSLLQHAVIHATPEKFQKIFGLYNDPAIKMDSRFKDLLLNPTSDGFSLLQQAVIHATPETFHL